MIVKDGVWKFDKSAFSSVSTGQFDTLSWKSQVKTVVIIKRNAVKVTSYCQWFRLVKKIVKGLSNEISQQDHQNKWARLTLHLPNLPTCTALCTKNALASDIEGCQWWGKILQFLQCLKSMSKFKTKNCQQVMVSSLLSDRATLYWYECNRIMYI